MAKKKRKKATLFTDLLVIIVFFIGLAVFAYPFVARAVNFVVVEYRLKRDAETAKKNAAAREKAQKEFNKRLAETGMRPNADVFRQPGKGIQDVSALKKHLIGAVTIPKLKVNVPLYDTVSDTLLASGAVVLPGTSYPTGGKSTHTVISAHSGVPSKTLFDDLEDLKKGQQFIITVNDKHLAYKVHQIKVIEPDDTSSLKIEAGRDLATLMTCTPVGINSHRLLVTGHRVPYSEATAKEADRGNRRAWWQNIGIIAAAVAAVALVITLIVRAVKKHRRVP